MNLQHVYSQPNAGTLYGQCFYPQYPNVLPVPISPNFQQTPVARPEPPRPETNLRQMSAEQTYDWIWKLGKFYDWEYADILANALSFKRNKIDGPKLINLTVPDYTKLGIVKLGHKLAICKAVEKLKREQQICNGYSMSHGSQPLNFEDLIQNDKITGAQTSHVAPTTKEERKIIRDLTDSEFEYSAPSVNDRGSSNHISRPDRITGRVCPPLRPLGAKLLLMWDKDVDRISLTQKLYSDFRKFGYEVDIPVVDMKPREYVILFPDKKSAEKAFENRQTLGYNLQKCYENKERTPIGGIKSQGSAQLLMDRASSSSKQDETSLILKPKEEKRLDTPESPCCHKEKKSTGLKVEEMTKSRTSQVAPVPEEEDKKITALSDSEFENSTVCSSSRETSADSSCSGRSGSSSGRSGSRLGRMARRKLRVVCDEKNDPSSFLSKLDNDFHNFGYQVEIDTLDIKPREYIIKFSNRKSAEKAYENRQQLGYNLERYGKCKYWSPRPSRKRPKLYKVIRPTAVFEKRSLESPKVKELQKGALVIVNSLKKRRVRVVEMGKVIGWASTHTDSDEQQLVPVNDDLHVVKKDQVFYF